MAAYIIKLLIMLPLVGGLAYGSLRLLRRLQPGLAAGQAERTVKLVETLALGTTDRLAVVEFNGRQLLLAVSRGRIELLTETGGPKNRASRREQANG